MTGSLMAAILASPANPSCAACGHGKVHHFGATDGKTPPSDDRRCWVYVRQKRRPHGCPCKGWVAPVEPES